jgi:endonuclease/exonuclease/phosphatase family metal-dependent hydrolase
VSQGDGTMPGEDLLNELRSFPSTRALHRSEFFARHRGEIESILSVPEILGSESTSPLLRSFVRVVQWNIERGEKYDRILACLRDDPVLRWADVVLLNEADCGMARSGRRHVARCLAEELGMRMVFAPAYLELGESNGGQEGLQGNAVLTRYPVLDARIARLPACHDPFESEARRYGNRNCAWAALQLPQRMLWVGSTHLEVRGTPACRARQGTHLVHSLPGVSQTPCLIGGDLNTHGFSRGTFLRTMLALAWLVLSRPEVTKQRLLRPERGTEPLFRVVRRAGFSWKGLNAPEATASTPLAGLEDASLLPAWLAGWARRRLEPFAGELHFKLDWLLGRGVRPLSSGEIHDAGSGIESAGAGCRPTIRAGPLRPSDHSPLYADIVF